MSRHYEICILLNPNSEKFRSEEKMKNIAQQIQDRYKGIVHRMEDCGNRILAYNINKCHKARYFLLNIEVGDNAIVEIEKELLRFDEVILRHLIVKRKEAETGESVLYTESKADQPKTKRFDFNQSSSKKRFSNKEQTKLSDVDYKNVELLLNYVMEGARIVPCRISVCTAKMQRAIRREIIRARSLALLPYCDTHKG